MLTLEQDQTPIQWDDAENKHNHYSQWFVMDQRILLLAPIICTDWNAHETYAGEFINFFLNSQSYSQEYTAYLFVFA